MTLFGLPLLRRAPRSAEIARERLRIVIAQEHADRSNPDYLPLLEQRLLQVIDEYLPVDRRKVEVRLTRGIEVSLLEIDVELAAAEAWALLEKAKER